MCWMTRDFEVLSHLRNQLLPLREVADHTCGAWDPVSRQGSMCPRHSGAAGTRLTV